MNKCKHQQQGFTTLFFTIIMLSLVGIVAFSMLFLSVYEFKSILNYSSYKQAYYLALGAQEEAMSLLSTNWNTIVETTPIHMGGGDYEYKIINLSPTKKKIISKGRASTIVRKFECIVEVPAYSLNLRNLINYVIYCNGNLTISDLAQIKQYDCINPGVLGVTGDLKVQSLTGGSCPLDVKGNINVRNGSKNAFIKMYSQVETELPLSKRVDLTEFTTWLENKYLDSIQNINIQDSEDFILEEMTNPTQLGVWDICIVRGGQNLHIKDVNFDGLLIIVDSKNIQVADSATIKGMIIIFGDKTDHISISGTIIGSVAIMNDRYHSDISGQLFYNNEILQQISSYLDYNHINNCTNYDLTMIKWNEIE